jgi:hypothetical protein
MIRVFANRRVAREVSMRSATACAALGALALACTTARLATPAGESKLGADEAALVEQEIGLIDAPALADYLGEIGARSRATRACVTRSPTSFASST